MRQTAGQIVRRKPPGEVEIDPPSSRLRELQADLSRRRLWFVFDPALEAAFIEDQRDGNARLARSGLLLAFALNAVFLLMDHFWLGQHYPPGLQRLYGYFVLPMLLLAFAVTGLAVLRRWTATITLAALVVVGIAFAWTGYRMVLVTDRPPYAFEAIVIYLVFVYFFSGARLVPAIAVSCGMLAIYLVSLVLSPVTASTTVYCMFFLLAVSGVGLIGRCLLDYATRRSYLSRLLAQELAERDSLTGLYNRRVFGERLDALLRQARENATPLTVMLLDIDRFKSVNDIAGHAFGDRILQETGLALTSACHHSTACAARLGGDEFAAVLTGLDPQDALAAAEQLRKAAESGYRACVDTLGTRSGSLAIGASIGVVTMIPRAPDDTAETLLRRADDALYAAKRGGRSRVIAG